MRLYVYRVNEREYGAGLGRASCERFGTIVEEWPLNTIEQAKFLISHGTAFLGATQKVSRIADCVKALMAEDPTFAMQDEPIRPMQLLTRPGFLQRIKAWFFDR